MTKRTANPEATLAAAKMALSYLADLNGSAWIKGDDAASEDMRQRAKAIQSLLNRAIRG